LREWARWMYVLFLRLFAFALSIVDIQLIYTHLTRSTPEGLPRRYDTTFFLSLLPVPPSSDSQGSTDPAFSEQVVTADGVETTSAVWLTPGEAIRRALVYTKELLGGSSSTAKEQEASELPSEGILLHPPQFNLIAELAAHHRSYRSLLASSPSSTSSSSSSSPSQLDQSLLIAPRRVATYLPRLIHVPISGTIPSFTGGGEEKKGETRRAMALPGDVFYETAAEKEGDGGVSGGEGEGRRKGRRNRTYVLPPQMGKAGLVVQGPSFFPLFPSLPC
jgi:hypothetical protein